MTNAVRKTTLFLGLLLGGSLLVRFIASEIKTEAASPQEIRLGLSDQKIKNHRSYRYIRGGHALSQTNYCSLKPDPDGGWYSVDCKGGKVKGVYVEYFPPVDRSKSVHTMERISGGDRIVEHDQRELSIAPDRKPLPAGLRPGFIQWYSSLPSEYFYFEDGTFAEINYGDHFNRKIKRLLVMKEENES